jgi:hypothetical protein
MDPTYRLRIATRLHFLLLRRYGQDIDVNLLLKSQAKKHDGLWLCRATGDAELIVLARQLTWANHAHALEEARLRAAAAQLADTAAGSATQEMSWSNDTSGFGVSKPQELNAKPGGAASGVGRWFNPVQWLKAGAQPASA